MLSRAVVLAVVLVAGCRGLPEADTTAAQTFARRCGECHRAYQPSSMTWPMWEYQLGRMHLLFDRLNKPWLSPEEERLVADYLKRHAEGAS
jgi:hypothetical protein